MIRSAGYSPADFSPRSSQHSSHHSSPRIAATADPIAIRRRLSQPNTVYAAVEEQHDSPDPIAVAMPDVVEVTDMADDAIIDEVTAENSALNETPETSANESVADNGSTETSDEFTDNDWNSILEDAGFSSDSPVQEVAASSEENTDGQNGEESEEEEETENEDDGDEDEDEDEEEEDGNTEDSNPASYHIPENSPTLLIDDSTSRFSGTEWYDEIRKSVVIIAGTGGIGSNLAFQIARMHPATLVLYDDDRVETSNMSGQLFSRDDIDRYKVFAVADMIGKYTTMTNAFAVNTKFTSRSEAGDIMMCGFDSMSARDIFFSSWRKHVEMKPFNERRKCLFLDGRLSIDTLQVLAMTGDDDYSINRYRREFLFSDHEAESTVCSLKQTTYLACMIASVMTNLFTNFIADSLNPEIPYDLPFFTEYNAQNMLFKTEV